MPDGSRIGGWLGVALGVLAGLGVALGLDQAAEPAGAQAEAVQVTAAQLLINQRISQAGVKRSNEALGLLAPVRPRGGSTPPGWPTAALAEGSVTFGKLADGAVRGAKLGDGAVSERHLSDELKVATAGPAFAAIGPDGAIRRASAVTDDGTEQVGPGSYKVRFAVDVRKCALVATPEPGGPNADDVGSIAVRETGEVFHVVNGSARTFVGVAVLTRDAAGAPADRAFHIAALC